MYDFKQILRDCIDTLSPGETIQVEHCKPGKRKLYIEMTPDGDMVLGKCFHCGLGAGVPTKFRTTRSLVNAFSAKTTKYPAEFPDDVVPITECINIFATQLVASWGLDRHYYQGFWYSESLRRVIVPCHNYMYYEHAEYLTLETRGWQGRAVIPAMDLKWLTAGTPGYHATFSRKCKHTALVFCEDMISAAMLAQNGYEAIALLGTSMSNKLLADLIRFDVPEKLSTTTMFVWLDNDSEQVIHKAHELVDVLSQTFDVQVAMVNEKADPKEVTTSRHMHSILCGAVK